jgi:hypothetical protein
VIGHYQNIINYYKDIHRLKTCGGYTILEIHTMLPYEMEIYAMQVLKDMQDREKARNA